MAFPCDGLTPPQTSLNPVLRSLNPGEEITFVLDHEAIRFKPSFAQIIQLNVTLPVNLTVNNSDDSQNDFALSVTVSFHITSSRLGPRVDNVSDPRRPMLEHYSGEGFCRFFHWHWSTDSREFSTFGWFMIDFSFFRTVFVNPSSTLGDPPLR
jgi:hypothetical protein